MGAVTRRCLICDGDDLRKDAVHGHLCNQCGSLGTFLTIDGVYNLPGAISVNSDIDAVYQCLVASEKNTRGWSLSPGARVLGGILKTMGFHKNPSARYVIRLLQDLNSSGEITLAKESSAGSGKRLLYKINDEVTYRGS